MLPIICAVYCCHGYMLKCFFFMITFECSFQFLICKRMNIYVMLFMLTYIFTLTYVPMTKYMQANLIS